MFHFLLEQPRIRILQKPSIIKEGDNVTFLCQSISKGRDKLSFQWFDTTNKIIGNTDGRIQLKNVLRNQSGYYSCAGSNGIGEPTIKSVMMIVNCK